MTSPQPESDAAERDKTSRHLYRAALALSAMALFLVVLARSGTGVRWPMLALPLLSIAQVGHAMGWTRRWPMVDRAFPGVMLVLTLITVVGIVRVFATR
ncbi:MAG: hypothetical protein V4617_18635 [Gemmatimonadota bacterium]